MDKGSGWEGKELVIFRASGQAKGCRRTRPTQKRLMRINTANAQAPSDQK